MMNPDCEAPSAAGDAPAAPPAEAGIEIATEAPNPRQRRLLAKVAIAAPQLLVWRVLTDYEALADFIPNLVACNRLEHPEGGIRLEQIGAQSLLKVDFKARAVLDLEEDFPREIRFHQVEGDFRAFEGHWQLESAGDCRTMLRYDLLVWPPRVMPVKFIEARLRQDLANNLRAIQQQVEARST